MPKIKWQVSFKTDEAAANVAFLFADEDVKDELRRILKVLAQQADPRSPKPDAGLIVDEIEHDSPGWFRVKIPRYGIRVIFRLIILRGKTIIELKSNEPVPDDADRKDIQIMQAGYRKDVYGEELKRRYRKYHLEEPEESEEPDES